MRKKSFVSGFLCALVLSLTISVFADTRFTKTISAAFGGLNIVVNGVRMSPKDVNNNAVQPILYGGTTYVPIRFLSEVFGSKATYVGSESTIYLGTQQKVEAFLLRDMTPIDRTAFSVPNYGTYGGWKSMQYPTDARFTVVDWSNTGTLKIADREYTSQSMMLSDGVRENSATYLLAGRYKRFIADFGIDDLSTDADTFGSVELVGDGKQLVRKPMKKGHVVEHLDVDLTGVQKLTVIVKGSSTSNIVGNDTVYSSQVLCDLFNIVLYPFDPVNTQP